jgi:hypothetical protein
MNVTKPKLLSLMLIIFLLSLSVNGYPAKLIKVDVLFMNHGPLMGTINKMKALFARYDGKISVSWYDFDTPEGEAFMEKKGIRQHTPLAIWINGNLTVKTGQKETTFVGFPSGAGPSAFQGKWTLDDLKAALDQTMAAK